MKTAFHKLPEFERGFFSAAFFTLNEDSPSGDFLQTGIAEELWARLSPKSGDELKKVCEAFRETHCELLARAKEEETREDTSDFGQGSDLWYTSQRHGCGFWEYKEKELGEALTEAAHKAIPEGLSLQKTGRWVQIL
jgi:hypothetical protein